MPPSKSEPVNTQLSANEVEEAARQILDGISMIER